MNITEFKGLSNKRDPLVSTPAYLKDCSNVDIDNSNIVRRRSGFSLFKNFTNIQASYTANDNNEAYIIADENLIKISDMSIISAGFTKSDYIFDDIERNLFIYDGSDLKLLSGNTVKSLNIPKCPQPAVSNISGSLPAGIYQVTAVYRNNNGLEGSASAPAVIELKPGEGISIQINQLQDHTVTIYISPPNGRYLYQWGNFSASSVIWDGPIVQLVSPIDKDNIGANSVPENCTTMQYHNTRLYFGEYLPNDNKTVIWFSLPFSYHLYRKNSDYLIIEGEVTNLVEVDGKLIITTHNAIYYYSDGIITRVAHYGAPKGSVTPSDQYGNTFLYSNYGICFLNEFANLTKEVYDFPNSFKVHSAIIRQNGFEKMINLLSDSSPAINTFRS